MKFLLLLSILVFGSAAAEEKKDEWGSIRPIT